MKIIKYEGQDITSNYGKTWRHPISGLKPDLNVPPTFFEGVTVEEISFEEEPILEDEIQNKVNGIKDRRDYLILNGGHKIGDNWFHSNELSLIQQLVLDGMSKQMQAGGAPDSTVLPNIPPWKVLGGSFVQLTVGIAKNFVVSAMTQQGALFSAAQVKIAEVQAMTDVQQVLNYDVNSGFPETYLE